MAITKIDTVAVLGAGVIGASWASLFLAAGLRVKVFDVVADAEQQVNDYVQQAWPTLKALGLTERAGGGQLEFYSSVAEAVQGAQFVQENVPEQLALKHQLYKEIEPQLPEDAIVASSASGLMVNELQQGWQNPSRFILGHPFNPPHLIPLVELLANEHTADGVLEEAEAFYANVGKVTIRVQKEVPAHVANRLQAALWKEAIYLVQSGVASVEDVDKAVWAGPGLRWAAMGPHQLFHLGAGAGGMAEFCERYADSFHRWWDDLGDTHIDAETTKLLVQGLVDATGDEGVQAQAVQRDALITGFLQARAAAQTSSKPDKT